MSRGGFQGLSRDHIFKSLGFDLDTDLARLGLVLNIFVAGTRISVQIIAFR